MTDYSEVSDVDFVRIMSRAAKSLHSREFREVKAEAERRGIERIRAANRHYVVDASLKAEANGE